jgi:hypothetical protein
MLFYWLDRPVRPEDCADPWSAALAAAAERERDESPPEDDGEP